MSARQLNRRPRRKFAAGDFRTPVSVLKSVTSSTLDGGINRTLEPLFTVFMNEQSLAPGTHRFAGVNVATDGNRAALATHMFTTRYRADLTAELILNRSSTRFEILEIQDLEGRKEYFVMRCRELGADDREATKA